MDERKIVLCKEDKGGNLF